MQDQKLIQSYINNFRRHIAAFLKPGIGLACKVRPAKKGGAVLEFLLGSNVGAAAGTIYQGVRGAKQVSIPAESLVTFTLQSPIYLDEGL